MLLATAIGVTTVSAQTCESVSAALEALAGGCTSMVRGDLCQNGQTTSLEGQNALEVDTLALAQIQASYPDIAPGRFVSMAFVGQLDVQPVVETTVDALPERVPVYVVVKGIQANVRPQPRTGIPSVAKLDDGTTLTATGISKSGTWVRVQLPDQPMQSAWINKTLLG
ncbi:MAG: SH3 domain-containing protein, partial [Chloroflexota bacterium]